MKNIKTLVIFFLIFNPFYFLQLYFLYNDNFCNTIESNSIKNLIDNYLNKKTEITTPINHLDNIRSNLYEVNSIYGNNLLNFLKRCELNSENENKYVKIIILFKNNLSYQEKLEFIENYFNDFKIISNYRIIPGLYLSCKVKDLINLKKDYPSNMTIKKIYKTNLYKIEIQNIKDSLKSLPIKDYDNWWLKAIGADNLPYSGEGIKIGIIDSGIGFHPDFSSRIIDSKNFASEGTKRDDKKIYDYNGHGTHVAGIIAGNGKVSSGKYRGIAPKALLINARAANYSGSLNEGDIIDAIDWLVNDEKVDIISMSFGGGFPDPNDPLSLAVSNAVRKGVICVAAAGNSGGEYFSGGTPAASFNCISVGAINNKLELASFSSWGPTFYSLNYPDLLAPGVNIISTENPGSIISNEFRYYGNYFNYFEDYGYIPLSGTSMACPMVAGAIALIKQAYPALTPEALRIALLEGATPIKGNDDEYVKQGAGIINISRTLNFLKKMDNVNNLSILLPKTLPIEPYDLLKFPGDKVKFNLTVISGIANNYTIKIPNNLKDISLSIDSTKLSFHKSGINYTTIEIGINLNATPSFKVFSLNLTDGNIVYDNITIRINIALPKLKIYLDSFHGLNDWFSTLDSTYNQIKLYKAIKMLYEMNCSVKYSMDFWSPNYNSDKNASLITKEILSLYDVLILQNPILSFTPEEKRAIIDFFNEGKTIILLGNMYQSICISDLNELLYKMGSGIQIKEKNIYDFENVGFGLYINSMNINEFYDKDIFNGVDKIYWDYGCAFNVGSNAKILAKLNNEIVIASYGTENPNNGQIYTFGSATWLTNEIFGNENYYDSHSRLLRNLINHIIENSKLLNNISIHLGIKSNIIFNNKTQISIELLDQSIYKGLIGLNSGIDFNLTVKNNDGNREKLIKLNEIGAGIYYNNSISFFNYSNNPYSLNFTLKYNGKKYTRTFYILFLNKSKIPKVLNYTILYDSIDRASTSSNNIDIKLNLQISNLTIYYCTTSGTPFIYKNNNYQINNHLNEKSPRLYQSIYIPKSSDPGGYVFFYTDSNSSDGYKQTNFKRDYFKIKNYNPKINSDKSYFKDIKFNSIVSENMIYLQRIDISESINFNISVNEEVNFEDSSDSLIVFIDFFIVSISAEGYIFLIIPENLSYIQLDYKKTSELFSGTYSLPKAFKYTILSGDISKSIISYGNYYGVFVVIAIDSDGGYDTFYIIVSIEEFNLNLFLILAIIIVICVIASIIIVFIRRGKKNKNLLIPKIKSSKKFYPDIFKPKRTVKLTKNIDYDVKFCPFCGSKIEPTYKFCDECGKSLEDI
ncbi:MAG: S8 family serine peptidase [Promethearchaeota archaeon]